jgi:hypothetical protein
MIKIHYNSLEGVLYKMMILARAYFQKHAPASKIVTENQVKKRKNPPEKADFKMDTLFFKTSFAFYSLPKPGR